MTPAPIAEFMVSMFPVPSSRHLQLLEPGAGIGSLVAAFVERACTQFSSIERISITAYEIDARLCGRLHETLDDCVRSAETRDVTVEYEIRNMDFVEHASHLIEGDLFGGTERFTHVVTNPPYRKVASDSAHRALLRLVGIESTNLYSGFVGLALKLLAPDGELVAITPRSFCNGPYFEPFRRLLLSLSALRQVHTFQSRDAAFRDDRVLQENIIYAVSRTGHPETVRLSTSNGPEFPSRKARIIAYSEVVRPDDPELLIHLPMTPDDDEVVRKLSGLRHSLQDLGITVSTGPVVEFRLRDFIHQKPVAATVPLLYPCHFRDGKVVWPRLDGRKPNAIVSSDETRKWLMPSGYYTITRRFSSKEEKRRIVAAVLDPGELDGSLIGIENHLNVFHQNGHGLDPVVAAGLSAYLNSTLVDQYFRLFNGHTQVNASDLRALRYPALSELRALGKKLSGSRPSQSMLDKWVAAVVVRRRPAA